MFVLADKPTLCIVGEFAGGGYVVFTYFGLLLLFAQVTKFSVSSMQKFFFTLRILAWR